MVKKYVKKPIVIEAVQWTGKNQEEILAFCNKADFFYDYKIDELRLTIKTLEGNHIATIGDFIIKGIKGEFYPCKLGIFEQTYEEAKNKSVYISGPMTGTSDWEERFGEAERSLKLDGYSVINPSRFVFTEEDGLREIMMAYLQSMSCCDAIYMLKGWENSSGAIIEKKFAEYLGIEVMYQNATVGAEKHGI